MSESTVDPKARLSHDEILEAGIDDWRKVLNSLRARFRTGDFATGVALVDRIGAAADEADHHPDVSLTYPEVIVTLRSHDVGGITSRDIDLARRISGFAAELGARADASGLTQLEPGVDTADGSRLAPFYAALLGGTVENGEPVDPSGQVPTLWFQEPPGPDDEQGAELPAPEVEQRWHFDVWVPHDEGERRLQAVLDAGGTLVSDAEAPAFWVVADADGNRSCICTPLTRG
ncbi:4a-hydroxytetrahydrobiopterin dehydratase [Nocardioides KLBMP 9356]|uniref:Putative pterin-4-alpha-carbinolamine dehydratase n=1 Tax=Nocardioides potassii TaxID=2911371 RepID=A0ABS9H9P9_9ACTN|nr:4a-hydroxytetrahydrobiopterin dehydratase [Nocardioides potassii]MCF6377053.1 4a-hydroxytetrahydrobiopterin dehydratase [Nocardioides potassii]